MTLKMANTLWATLTVWMLGCALGPSGTIVEHAVGSTTPACYTPSFQYACLPCHAGEDVRTLKQRAAESAAVRLGLMVCATDSEANK